jgi:hypothetical protein
MPARFKKKQKDIDAIVVGGLGASLGGTARAEKLKPKHLSKIGKHGAHTRWHKSKR